MTPHGAAAESVRDLREPRESHGTQQRAHRRADLSFRPEADFALRVSAPLPPKGVRKVPRQVWLARGGLHFCRVPGGLGRTPGSWNCFRRPRPHSVQRASTIRRDPGGARGGCAEAASLGDLSRGRGLVRRSARWVWRGQDVCCLERTALG